MENIRLSSRPRVHLINLNSPNLYKLQGRVEQELHSVEQYGCCRMVL